MLTLDSTTVWVNEIVDQIIAKMDWLSEKSRNKIPYTTIDGEHDDRSVCNPTRTEADGINWWTNGFWGGNAVADVSCNGQSEIQGRC
ncbi:hypothetical protein PPSQR21_025440 [Paenibacillus polymyxa SQR-21]|nr:hypothetical protein [Paenibacillus polymyxa]AHM66186.1 hypothetical protein PPSQR21_025440 [Paenibacillus polymyxa SQR-21]